MASRRASSAKPARPASGAKPARRPSRAGVRYKKSEATHEHLLATAIELIARRGLAGTSFTELAEAAGTSKGGIAYYFESKDELLASVLARSCALMEDRVRAAFLAGDGAPLERVRRALAEMWRHRSEGVAEMRALIELHVYARQEPALRRSLADALERARRQMVDIGLSALLTLGIQPRVDPELVPRLIIATLDGLALQHEIDPLSEGKQAALLEALEAMITSLFAIP